MGGGGAVVGGVGRNLSLGLLAPLVRRGFAIAKPLSFHATHYTHAVRSVTPLTPPLSLSRRRFGVLKILSAGRSLRCLGGGDQNYTRCVAHSRSPCAVRSPACVRARFSRAFGARTLAVTPSTPPISLSRRSFGVLKILSTGSSLRCLGGGAQNCTRCVAHSRSPCVVRSSACVRARFSHAS